MLSLSSNRFSVPRLEEISRQYSDGETIKRFVWVVDEIITDDLGNPNSMRITQNFNWTVQPYSQFVEWDEFGNSDGDNAHAKISGEERVTWLFTVDGRIRPSSRSLRVYGSEKIGEFLKGMYKGGDPRKGRRFNGTVCAY